MFSLAIVLVALALISLTVVVALNYGGKSFGKGADTATAARLVNEGQQLNAANVLYRANLAMDPAGGTALTLQDLVTAGYLSSVPSDFDGTFKLTEPLTVPTTAEVCAEITKRIGASGMFSCSQVNGEFVFSVVLN